MSQIQMFYKYTFTFFKSVYRNKVAFFFMLIFPLMFVGIFGLAFQTSDPTNTTIQIGIINYDTGIPNGVIAFDFQGNSTVNGTYYSEQYISLLKTLKYSNTSIPIFNIIEYSPSDSKVAENSLERRDIKALVILEKDFSIGFLAAFRKKYENNPFISLATHNWDNYPSTNYTTKIIVRGDRTLQQFSIASSIIDKYTLSFFNLGSSYVVGGEAVIEGNYESKGFTVFDEIVPGLIIFATLQTLSSIAVNSLHDVESGILERVKLTKINKTTYVSALIANQVLLSIIQLPLMLFTSVLFGFPMTWNLLPAFLVAIILSLGITGIGFIIAGTVKNADAAIAFANILSVPMAFLSGSFFTVPNPTIISKNSFLGGNELKLFDFLPSTPGVRLMRAILLGGHSLKNNAFDLILIISVSAFYLLIGLVLYSRKHFRAE